MQDQLMQIANSTDQNEDFVDPNSTTQQCQSPQFELDQQQTNQTEITTDVQIKTQRKKKVPNFSQLRVQASRQAKTATVTKPQNITSQVAKIPKTPQLLIENGDPYHLIKILENEGNNDAIICDICLEDDDFEDDEIIICDLCCAASHQTCYGGEIKDRLPLPEQPWYCARCQELLLNKDKKCFDVKCQLCPQIQGMMKPISEDRRTWAHLICVNWTPEIWFTDDFKTTVGGTILKQRQELSCGVCHKKEGSCIQCDYQNCSRAWHVRCAAQSGIIKTWDEMQEELGNPINNMTTPIFCKEHSEKGTSVFKLKGEQGLIQNKKATSLKVKTKITKTSNMIKKTPLSQSKRASMRIREKPKNVTFNIPQTPTQIAASSQKQQKKRKVAPVKAVISKSKAPPKSSENQTKVGIHKKEQQTNKQMQVAATPSFVSPQNQLSTPAQTKAQTKTQAKTKAAPVTQAQPVIEITNSKPTLNQAPPMMMQNTDQSMNMPGQFDMQKFLLENPHVAAQMMQQMNKGPNQQIQYYNQPATVQMPQQYVGQNVTTTEPTGNQTTSAQIGQGRTTGRRVANKGNQKQVNGVQQQGQIQQVNVQQMMSQNIHPSMIGQHQMPQQLNYGNQGPQYSNQMKIMYPNNYPGSIFGSGVPLPSIRKK